MTLKRLNPESIYQPYANRYTQVIIAKGETQVHLAGMVSQDVDQNLVGEGDMLLQTKTVMDNIGKALEAAGATPADVVRINTYTVDVPQFRAEGHVAVLEFFEGNLPVSTLVGVTQLADPRFLVEIEAVAVID